jgi:hypothetical protein
VIIIRNCPVATVFWAIDDVFAKEEAKTESDSGKQLTRYMAFEAWLRIYKVRLVLIVTSMKLDE